MNNQLSIKKSITEAKMFAMIVTSKYGQILYMGVHFNLDEAYSVARRKIESIAPHNPNDSVDIGLWNSIPAKVVMEGFLESGSGLMILPATGIHVELDSYPVSNSVEDYVKDIKDSKNDLMKKLIEDGDLEQVEKLKDFLGTYSKRFVVKAIKEKMVDNPANNGKI